jgi:hypothetical protein
MRRRLVGLSWLLVGLTTLGLGIDGYLVSGSHLIAAVYNTLNLFGFDYLAPPGPVSWQLQVARFEGIIVAASAILAITGVLLRERVDGLRAAVSRKHIVVVGLGARGMLLVTSLRRDGHRVVAVERGGDTKAFSAAQAEHVPVVVGDALDLSVLRAARVQNASYVVCLLSSTEDNVAVALAARRLLAESPTASPDPILLVYARPYGYVSTLRDIHFGRLRAAGSLLESMDFINVEENVAQQLLRRWKLKVQDGQRGLGNGSDVVVPDTLVLLGLS